MFNSLLIYVTVFLLSALTAHMSVKLKSKLFAFIAVLIPTLFVGLRLSVGTDYDAYVHMYEQFSQINFLDFIQISGPSAIEIGFYGIIQLSSLLSEKAWPMFLLSSFATIGISYWAIRRISPNNSALAYLLFLLILLPFTLNGIRQGISMSLIFLAISYMLHGNPKKYTLTILVAALFHTSSLLILPLYLLKRYVEKERRGVAASITALVVPVLLISIATPILVLTGDNLPVISQYTQYTGVAAGVGIITLLLRPPLIITTFALYKRLGLNSVVIRWMIIFILIETVCMLLGSVSGVFSRMRYYFAIGTIIYIASTPNAFSSGASTAKLLAVGYGLIYFIAAYYIAGYSDIFPYESVIGGM